MILAPHLAWSEVLRSSGVVGPAGLPPGIRANIERMAVTMFEPLREAWESPLLVVSGYRTEAINTAADGKPKSQHIEGLALDLVPVSGREDCEELYDIIAILQGDGGLPRGGLSLYARRDGSPRFVHVDCRGKRARWGKKDAQGRWVTRRPQLPDVA